MSARDELEQALRTVEVDGQRWIRVGAEASQVADVVLAHIGAVLRDEATAAAVAKGVYNATAKRETGLDWERLSGRPSEAIHLGMADGLIDIIAERLVVQP